MQFNPGDGTGVIDEIDDICGSNNVTYPIKSKTRRVNFALDQFYSIALAYEKHWTFDDPTRYDVDGRERKLPIAVADLRAGEQDYPFARELLTINSVFVKDNQGLFHEITEQDDPQNTFLLNSNNKGVPTKYKIVGSSILLDFIPNYNMKGGLKVVFTRNCVKFEITDEDKELEIPSLFHEWICQVASLPYLIKNKLPNKNDIATLIANKKDPRLLDSIPYFMANRNKSVKPRLETKQEFDR